MVSIFHPLLRKLKAATIVDFDDYMFHLEIVSIGMHSNTYLRNRSVARKTPWYKDLFYKSLSHVRMDSGEVRISVLWHSYVFIKDSEKRGVK